jgi:hypothetical protein
MPVRDVEMAVAALDRPRRSASIPITSGGQAMANKLTLREDIISRSTTRSAAIRPSPALSYKKGSFSKTFKPGEIHADPTVLGSLVSVALVKTIDTGGLLLRVPFAADRRSARSNRSFRHGRHLRAQQRVEFDPASPDDVGDFRA